MSVDNIFAYQSKCQKGIPLCWKSNFCQNINSAVMIFQNKDTFETFKTFEVYYQHVITAF